MAELCSAFRSFAPIIAFVLFAVCGPLGVLSGAVAVVGYAAKLERGVSKDLAWLYKYGVRALVVFASGFVFAVLLLILAASAGFISQLLGLGACN